MKNCFILLFVMCGSSNAFAQCWTRNISCCDTQQSRVWQRPLCYIPQQQSCEQSYNDCNSQISNVTTPSNEAIPSNKLEISPQQSLESNPSPQLKPQQFKKPLQGEVVPKFDLSIVLPNISVTPYNSVLTRTWTDNTGLFQVKGKLISVVKGTINGYTDIYVAIKKDSGSVVKVAINRLSTQDKQYIKLNQSFFVSQ